MRGAAFEFARRLRSHLDEIDVLFTTSAFDLGHLLALLPKRLPTVLHLHENQAACPPCGREEAAEFHSACLYEGEVDLETRVEALLTERSQRLRPAALRATAGGYAWEERVPVWDGLVAQVSRRPGFPARETVI